MNIAWALDNCNRLLKILIDWRFFNCDKGFGGSSYFGRIGIFSSELKESVANFSFAVF